MSIVQSCQLIFFLNCKWHTEQAFCLWTQRNDSLWPTSQQSDEQTSALIDRNDLNSTDWGRTELISHKKDWCCCCSCCWEFVVGFFSLLWKTQILFLDKAKWIANINSTYNRLRRISPASSYALPSRIVYIFHKSTAILAILLLSYHLLLYCLTFNKENYF